MTTYTVTEIEARVAAAKTGDLATYAEAVHRQSMEPYQQSWEYALDNLDRVCIVCPPDTYKSTTVQHWVEKAIGKDPNIRILWLMNAGEQAQKRVMSVAATIKSNPIYTRAFDVVEDEEGQWTKSVLYVKREIESPDPTLMGTGFNGPYQGSHFDRIIIDDPTNQEDVHSPATMEMQKLKLRGVIIDRLVDTGKIIVILTRWGENDLVPELEDMGFTIIEMPIIGNYPWGPTISNKRFPMIRCDQIRRDKTDAIFQLTYMCNPRGMQTNGIIRREYIKYWDQENLPGGANLSIMAVDPSPGRAGGDPACIGTALIDLKTRYIYITDMWDELAEVQEFENEFRKRAEHTARLIAIGVETIGYQLTFLQRFRREKKYPIRELPYRSRRQSTLKAIGIDRTKEGRAISVAQAFIQGRLFLPRYLPMFEGVSIEDELCSFPFGKHDDRMDVLAFLIGLADAYAKPRQFIRIRS